MSVGEFEQLFSGIQALVTALSLIIGGAWVYTRYIRQQENYPNIEFSADIHFIGTQANYWIVEVIALIENKGKAQHRMTNLSFDLKALFPQDPINTSDKWRGQVEFPHRIAEGSFLPHDEGFFFVDPGLKEKYSYITKVPIDTTFVMLHCWFNTKRLDHSAEKTVRVPGQIEKAS